MKAEDLMDMATLSGSAIATAITAYFWLVRSRREAPDLRFYMVAPLDGNQSGGREGNRLDCHVLARSVVANYSMLPDTLIAIRVWLLLATGEWVEARLAGGERSPFPVNLAAMHSALVNLEMTFTGSGDLTGSSSVSRRDASLAHLSTPARIRVEMQGLSNTPHVVEVTAQRPTSAA